MLELEPVYVLPQVLLRSSLQCEMVKKFDAQRADGLLITFRLKESAWLAPFIQVSAWRAVVYQLMTQLRGQESSFLKFVLLQISYCEGYDQDLLSRRAVGADGPAVVVTTGAAAPPSSCPPLPCVNASAEVFFSFSGWNLLKKEKRKPSKLPNNAAAAASVPHKFPKKHKYAPSS